MLSCHRCRRHEQGDRHRISSYVPSRLQLDPESRVTLAAELTPLMSGSRRLNIQLPRFLTRILCLHQHTYFYSNLTVVRSYGQLSIGSFFYETPRTVLSAVASFNSYAAAAER